MLAPPTAWQRLNPLTRLVLAVVTTGAALTLSSYLALGLLGGALVVLPAMSAGAVRRVTGRTILVSLPILVAVALVSILTRAGSTVLFTIGPFDATAEGVDFAARISLRLLVMAGALVLFGLTTPARHVVADLERRGVSPSLTFATAAVLEAVPAMLERARMIQDAQRSRALDIEGGVRARLRGVIPLVGPAVLGSLHDVEARSLALEARGFGRPGRRFVLWAPPDRPIERVARWALCAFLVALIVIGAAGSLAGLP